MTDIQVEGIGRVQIQGQAPTPEEARRILAATKAIREKRDREQAAVQAGEELGLVPSGDPASGAIPEPIDTNLIAGEERSAARRGRFQKLVRDPNIMTGGLAGAEVGFAAGTPFGPPGQILGTLIGGGLGVAGGSAFSDVEQNLLAQVFPDDLQELGVRDISERALRELGIDVTTSAGVSSAIKVFNPLKLLPGISRLGVQYTSEAGAALFGKIFGLRTPEAERIRKMAEASGVGPESAIPLGGVNVGNRFAKGAAQTVGVFPVIGSEFRNVRRQLDERVLRNMNETVEAFAPYEITASQLGIDALTAARSVSSEFRGIEGALWDRFRALSADLGDAGDFIPTAKTQEAVADILGNLRTFRTKAPGKVDPLAAMTGVKPEPGTVTQELPDPLKGFLAKLSDIVDFITPAEHRALMLEYKAILDRSAKKEGFTFKRAADLKAALKADIAEADFTRIADPEAGVAIQEAYNAANEFTAKGILNGVEDARFPGGRNLFGEPGAANLKSVDPNLFERGSFKLTRKTEEDAASLLLHFKSPELVRSYARLVGPGTMRNAAGKFMRDTVDASFVQPQAGLIKDEFLDPARVIKGLGLKGKSLADEAKRELLKRSGVNVPLLTETLDLAKLAIDPKDPATFVTRRVILNGAGAIAGSFLLAKGAGDPAGGLAGPLLLSLLARRGSTLLAKPEALRAIQTALRGSVRPEIARQATGRAIRLLIQDDADFREEVLRNIREQQSR